MKKYWQLLKFLYIAAKVWLANQEQEEQEIRCEYCNQAVFDNICSHCGRTQPNYKLNLTTVDKQGYFIEAWEKRLEDKTRWYNEKGPS